MLKSLVLTDVDDVFGWSTNLTFYNPLDGVAQKITEFDDGRVATTEFVDGVRSVMTLINYEDVYGWDTRVTSFDALGNVVSVVKTYDGIPEDPVEPPFEPPVEAALIFG